MYCWLQNMKHRYSITKKTNQKFRDFMLLLSSVICLCIFVWRRFDCVFCLNDVDIWFWVGKMASIRVDSSLNYSNWRDIWVLYITLTNFPNMASFGLIRPPYIMAYIKVSIKLLKLEIYLTWNMLQKLQALGARVLHAWRRGWEDRCVCFRSLVIGAYLWQEASRCLSPKLA